MKFKKNHRCAYAYMLHTKSIRVPCNASLEIKSRDSQCVHTSELGCIKHLIQGTYMYMKYSVPHLLCSCYIG